MIGYVRCFPPEMKVKHYRLYQAAYCGLCHTVKNAVSRFLLPFLSYDFVFLALCRMTLEKEEIVMENNQCFLHPFSKRKKRIAQNPALLFAARASLCFLLEKMRDDRLDHDAPLFRRVLCFFYEPFLRLAMRRLVRKEPSFGTFSKDMRAKMEQLRALEKAHASPDDVCRPFADVMAQVFSFGLTGDTAQVFSEIGEHLGCFIYTLDALDDREKDAKTGAFNPYLEGGMPDAKSLAALDLVQSFHLQRILDAWSTLSGDDNILAVCRNIIEYGLCDAQRRVLKLETGEVK